MKRMMRGMTRCRSIRYGEDSLGSDFLGLGPHASFILGAYGVVALTLLGMVAWVMIDHRRQTGTLADLERRGMTRRSARSGGEAR